MTLHRISYTYDTHCSNTCSNTCSNNGVFNTTRTNYNLQSDKSDTLQVIEYHTN